MGEEKQVFLSILFSSRHSLQSGRLRYGYLPFNPLFIETIPSIAPYSTLIIFQSPFHRDNSCPLSITDIEKKLSILFSSRLLISFLTLRSLLSFQSSFHRDSTSRFRIRIFRPYFQSSFHRDYCEASIWCKHANILSILFSSRRTYWRARRSLTGWSFQSSFHRDTIEELKKNIAAELTFQSSFHRDLGYELHCLNCDLAFNPLFIETENNEIYITFDLEDFQSSFHRD